MSRLVDPAAVTMSAEEFADVSDSVRVCYQTFGDPSDEPVLLIMGLGGPMIWWDEQFCRLLASRGFHVIRFDNRDTGRSTKVPGQVDRSLLLRAVAGRPVAVPYRLDDLAGDAAGLLDHLGLPSAHVVGVSLGGMIAQTLAISETRRVRSLVSIMSTTGRRTAGWLHPSLAPLMLADRGRDRDAYIEGSLKTWQLIGSPGYPLDEQRARQRAADTFDRGFSASGVLRQLLTAVTQPNREAGLARLNLAATVIHGKRDKMVHVSGGRATAAAIPAARLVLIDQMGHDLPPALFETFVNEIEATAHQA